MKKQTQVSKIEDSCSLVSQSGFSSFSCEEADPVSKIQKILVVLCHNLGLVPSSFSCDERDPR